MAALTRILTLICVAGGHLSPASPVLRSALVVRAGQNTSLTCNLTSSSDITWYHLRSDQLLPLLTVRMNKFMEEEVDLHAADGRRLSSGGGLESGAVGLDILQVEETDAGLYFCTGRCAGAAVCVGRGIHLAVDGADGESAARQPCWTLGICVLPASLVLCVVIIFGLYLCSGKPAVCCCNSPRGNMSLRVTEDDSLHYSSLKLAEKPRPSRRAGTRLVEEDVTYSTVANRKNPNGSCDFR
ncbi:uncharacterized protein [Pagrus major]|uniref:uncharacterized protein n=1 Tax=Pagrus major TaxID=143350 RepID=UPI003CC8406B